AEQIQQALGSEKVKEMAAKFGIPVDKGAEVVDRETLRYILRASTSSRDRGGPRPSPSPGRRTRAGTERCVCRKSYREYRSSHRPRRFRRASGGRSLRP